MMRWFRNKPRPRVFLGAISVHQRTDLKRHLEQEGHGESESLDEALRRTLMEIFSLPPAASVEDPSATDLVLDVWIPNFQSGEVVNMDIGEGFIPLLWRPKVTVSSSLYSMVTRKPKASFVVTEKMQWRRFLGRIFSWRVFSSQIFERADLELLLFQACAKLVTKMKKVLAQ